MRLSLSLVMLAAAVALVPAGSAQASAAKRPTLVGVESAGKATVALRWSASVRVARTGAARAFDVRTADSRRVAVRSVRRSTRPDTLTLVLARAVTVTRVRYLPASKFVRGLDGRPAAATAVAAQAAAPPSRPRPPRVEPTPSAAPSLPVAPAPTASPEPVSAEPPAQSPNDIPQSPAAEVPWSSLRSPIEASQHELMPFGKRSFWLQPWRAYMETVPGTVLRDAVGINFNVAPEDAARTARALAAAGVRRARVEFGWDGMRFDDPSALANPGRIDTILRALDDNGIRPLLLLNANHGAPTPVRLQTLTLAVAARAGDRSVRLATGDVASVVPGRTGFNALDGSYKAADVLITDVQPNGVATLSKPLPRDLAAGAQPATTLRFAPFAAPQRLDGSANPAFEQTLAGWLSYVGAVTARARLVLGDDHFDVEVWNELSFGSDFLDARRYYDPLPPAMSGSGDVQRALLERTVAWLRDPGHGVAGVGIGDGFASESPWPSGATEPVGVTALAKHPYAAVRDYPANVQTNTIALGPTGQLATWTPSLRAFFPEYWLSGLQTETLVRDLSPVTTDVYGTPHGRATRPAGGAAPEMWLTEAGIDLDDGRLPQAELTPAAKRHILTKGALRSLVAHVNKGVTAVDFYAARGYVYGFIEESFFAGAPGGGETLDALARLTAPFATSQTLTSRRALTLDAVSDRHDHRQFAGDGTSAHPPLYDRDVVAVLPFQLSDRRFAIPAYVMTRDVTRLQRPAAPRSDVTRWDLPEATFRLALGGLNRNVRLTAQDPLTGAAVPVTVVSRTSSQIVLELPLTDSPRIILADEG